MRMASLPLEKRGRPGQATAKGDHEDIVARVDPAVADRLGEGDQIVGGLAHRRHDHDHVVPALLGERDVVGNRLDAVGVGYGVADVFLADFLSLGLSSFSL